jgi:hypothetical protein
LFEAGVAGNLVGKNSYLRDETTCLQVRGHLRGD